MDFSKLSQPHQSDACSVEYGGQTLSFHFDHNKVTTRRLDDMHRELSDGGISAIADFLADVLMDWDMTADGDPAPIEYAFLVELPQPLISKMFRVVAEATGEGKSENEQRNGSRPTSRERRQQARAGR